MKKSAFHFADGVTFRYFTDRGDVVVMSLHRGEDRAALYLGQRDAVLAAQVMTDEDFRMSSVAASVRNRFGIGMIRPILRDVKRSMPWIKTWVLDRTPRLHGKRHEVMEV